MFLVPVMVGIASREVRRSPRGGAAGLEPRRITGEVGERPKVCWGTIKEGEGSSVVWLESAQECGVGGKESKERSSAPQGALPAPPPARSRRQLANCWNSAGRERAPYIEPGSAAALGRRAGGGERTLTWLGSPGNAARGSRTSGAFLASHWPPPIFFIWGWGRRGLGAGQAAWAPGATWRVRRR